MLWRYHRCKRDEIRAMTILLTEGIFASDAAHMRMLWMFTA
ncbi:MAG: hypothetical protein H6R18_181 [Proteobacteria bacterium]|nr:hypothetical protein [Pseudomonadota bacterium]